MKRNLLCLSVACVLMAGLARAQDATVPDVAPAPAPEPAANPAAPTPAPLPLAWGLVQKGSRAEEGRDFLALEDPSGGDLLVSAEADPDAQRIKAILSASAALRSWKDAEFTEIRVVNYADRFQLLAVPTRLMAGGRDLAPLLPGGLQLFWQAGAMEYDFRFMVTDFYVRMRGIYSSGADLSTLLLSVLRDPAAYVLSSDPLFVLKRLEADSARISALEGELKAASSAFDRLRAELQAQEAMARRLVATASASLNGGKAVPFATVQKILELRAADPKFDRTKAVARLKEAGISATQKEVDAVFLTAFGE